MIKIFLAVFLSLLSFPIAGFADTQNTAKDVVACINSTNGYADQFEGDQWELPQAILVIPSEHEQFRLMDGYHLVGGRSLGWHGTWVAFLDLRNEEWVAFETRDEIDESVAFAESYVPVEVVEAFVTCRVEWGGYWTEEYPFIEVGEAQKPIAPQNHEPETYEPPDGVNLLPPKVSD